MSDPSQLSDAELLAALSNGQGLPSPTGDVSPAVVTAPSLQNAPVRTAGGRDGAITGLSDADLLAQLKGAQGPDYDNSRPMSVGEDVGRSTVSNLESGAAHSPVLGGLGDILQLWGNGVDWLGGKAIGALQDFSGTDLGAPYKGANLGRMAAAVDNPAPPDPFANYAHDNGVATGADYDKLIQEHFGKYHAPQTEAGRMAGAVAFALPSTLTAAETLPGAVVGATGTGVGSETAGALTKGTPLEGPARVAGGVLGGGLTLGARAMLRSPEEQVRRAAGDITPPQFSAAQALMTDTAARGQPGTKLTWPEAIQQTTNGATALGRLQRILESTKQGEQQLAPFFAQRPAQVRGAVTQFADRVSPFEPNPSAIGTRAQAAAQTALTRVYGARTKATRPDYAAAESQTVPGSDVQDIVDALDNHIATDKTGLLAPSLQELRDHLVPDGINPITDIGNLDRIRKFYRDYKMKLPMDADGALTGEQSGAIGTHIDNLDNLMETVPEFAKAKAAHADYSRAVVEPIEAGPVGKIRSTADVHSLTPALYPAQPLEGAPVETGTAIRLLNATDPTVAPALTRQHVMGTLNANARDLQGGPNQWGGANTYAALAGNPEARATLEAGVNAIGGAPLKQDLGGLLDYLQATGRRERIGSRTAFNASDIQGLSPNKAGRFLARAGDPLEWGRGIGDILGSLQYGRNARALADWMTSGAAPAGRNASIQAALSPVPVTPTNPVLTYLTGRH